MAAPGATGDLGEELEGAFGGAKIGAAEGEIGSYDSDERDALEIVALGDHLRADEDIDLTFRECAEHLLEFALGAEGVAVEAADAGGWELLAEVFVDALGAVADEVHVPGLAFPTLLGRADRIAAIVAFKALAAFVVGEGGVAILALNHRAAAAAEHRPGIAAAIDEDHCLCFFLEAQRDRNAQGLGNRRDSVLAQKILAQVDDADLGERAIFDARSELEELVFSCAGVVVGLKRRRRGAEEHGGVFKAPAINGGVAAVVARRFLLLVGGFLLLIDDDEAEIFERGEDGRARADDDAGFAAADAPPFASAFDIRQAAV